VFAGCQGAVLKVREGGGGSCAGAPTKGQARRLVRHSRGEAGVWWFSGAREQLVAAGRVGVLCRGLYRKLFADRVSCEYGWVCLLPTNVHDNSAQSRWQTVFRKAWDR
jgi:hypothetical protein